MEALLLEVGSGQIDCRPRQVDAGHFGASSGEAHEIDAGSAADLQNPAPAIFVKGHEPQEMMKLLEMVPIEIVEESAGADRMLSDLEVVDVPVPVRAHLIGRRHARHNNAALKRLGQTSCPR